MRKVSIFVAIFSVAVVLTCASSVSAQVTASGTLTGQVKDSQGASVPGAEVTLIDIEKNASQNTTTNDSGRFTFVNIHPGLYDLTVSKSGFKVAKLSQQKVTIGLVVTLDITLEVGAVTETVVVTSVAGTELQTTNATIGTTISAKQLEQLTNFGRDANALFVYQPVTTPGGNVAGAVVDQNTFQLDGGNNSSDMDGTQNVYTQSAGFIGSAAAGGTPSGVLPTPAESVEEFRVATNNQTADFNGSAGAQIQMVTKRGTNSFHGSAYWYYFGTNFSANSWTNNRTSTRKAITHQNRFGFSASGPILPKLLGGKTYLFGNYEGRRFPQTVTFERLVPSALLRAGVIQVQNSGTGAVPVTVNGVTYPVGAWVPYNLNPTAVTVNGVTYQPANVCGSGGNQPCDPRAIGLNPIVRQIWTNFMPLPNNPSAGDNFNTQGYRANLPLPQNSDFFVARIDHDFGPKWRFMGSYRVYDFAQFANTQVDIGGNLPGNTLGQPASAAPRVQKPSYYVAGLTTNITSTLINDFRYSYLRNFWEWGTAGAPPQLAGLGGAVEIGGESANALIPVNVNAQNARQRFWDGQDHTFRDDLTWIHGNHTFQFGGLYQRNFNFHQRNDNGQSTMTSITYVIQGGQSGFSMTGFRAGSLPSGGTQNNTWDNLYAQVLGLVTLPQVVYSRAGQNLALQPLGTPAFDKAIIPTYSAYFSDTWRMTPTFTLTYGLNYAVEMPPYEIDGKQVMVVDDTGKAITTRDYLARRQTAALAGQVYNPVLGFATIRNVVGQGKYPYEPYYGGWSPSIAAAWNPRFEHGVLGFLFGNGRTVLRGGYRRVIGRLNGVDLVLVPLLGTGLLQTVQCEGAVNAAAAVAGNQCLGTGRANPNNGFRIGTDGNVAPLATASANLAQPYYPGVAGNVAAGDGSALDPEFRPNMSDQWSFSIQRELVRNKLVIEFGYVGRNITREWQQVNLDAIPHMTTLGGQTFSDAFAKLYLAVAGGQPIVAQPWFEAALGGGSSPYCTGFASCTAAVASRQASNIRSTLVYSLWTNLESQTSWTLGRTLGFSSRCENKIVPALNPNTAVPVCSQYRSIFMNSSLGWGNYHAGFVSLNMRDWHGFTTRSNFTWSHALGTGAEVQARSSRSVVNPWDLSVNYGPQDFDIRFLFNTSVLYEPPFFKEQRGLLGRLLGGWAITPLFTAQSGLPLRVSINTGVNGNCQSFGEMNCNSGSAWENAVLISPYTGGNTLHPNIIGSGGVGTNANPAVPTRGSGMNMFSDPAAVLGQFRRLIVGIDGRGGAAGPMRGFPRWNLDLSIAKDIRWSERFGATFSVQFANVLNHFQPSDPTLNIDSPASWGVVTGAAYDPRQVELGLRIRF